MTMLQTVAQTCSENLATSLAVAAGGGVLLQRFFNIVGIVAGFFKSKPALAPEVLALIEDLKNHKPILDNILEILATLKEQNVPAAKG